MCILWGLCRTADSDPVGLGRSLRIGISNQFLADADAGDRALRISALETTVASSAVDKERSGRSRQVCRKIAPDADFRGDCTGCKRVGVWLTWELAFGCGSDRRAWGLAEGHMESETSTRHRADSLHVCLNF